MVWGFELTDSEHAGPRTLGLIRDYGGWGVGYLVDWQFSARDFVDWYPRESLEPLCRPVVGEVVWAYADDDYHQAGEQREAQVSTCRPAGMEIECLLNYRTVGGVRHRDFVNWVPTRRLSIATIPRQNRSINSSRTFVALMRNQ